MGITEIKTTVPAEQKRALIIAANFNDLIVSRLVEGAVRAFHSASIADSAISLIRVAGALEIPLALKAAARTNQFNVFVVVGAIIKGHTDHYDHVARMANDGVLSVALEHNLALGNKILTVHSLEHALERADGPHGNAGHDAAMAALGLFDTYAAINLLKRAQ